MRLSSDEIHAILESHKEIGIKLGFLVKRISLFGSRTDDKKKGGDIDLYTEIEPTEKSTLTDIKRAIRNAIADRIGDQKIDIIVDDGKVEIGAFKDIISETGKILWTKKN